MIRKVVSVFFVFMCAFFSGSAFAFSPMYPNLFKDWLGCSDSQVDAKLDAVWNQLFYGDDATERVYYPVGDDMAYIADVGNGDVRSEGMSYGMMIAVQTNHREEFDRLWKWAKTYMYHSKGDRKGYFAWQCSYEGNVIDPATASDGEEWIATALLFASNRWGDREGIFNYKAEALKLLDLMLTKADEGNSFFKSIFDREQKQVVFVPQDNAAAFTDPSYHLPAFYELWELEDSKNAAFWREVAATSRKQFKQFAHPKTGLMPDYANFDGSPKTGWGGHEDFRFDAWRTLSNVALDYLWFQKDPWQVAQSKRVLTFLSQFGENCPNQMTLDGKSLSSDSSIGLYAMAAVAGTVAGKDLGEYYARHLWNAPIPTGKWRYYDGLIYYIGMLQCSGAFNAYISE
jgi:oligosaccharide reducing-end xylanase